MRLGYALSSEEHPPQDLVRYAREAEARGFDFCFISDHFHPWVSRQGHSPFVWSVLGAISQTTSRIPFGTGVTAPIIRTHPAVIAHAAATTAAMLPGRFMFGVGTGENLNEHVVGEGWPDADDRLAMLEEAIEVIRQLWTGEEVTFRGGHYKVDRARLYTLPDEPPPILIAAKGDKALEFAAQAGDGLVGLTPEREFIERFESAGGRGKPRYGQLHVCWAENESEAKRTAHEWWPNTAVPPKPTVDLASPADFEEAAKEVSAEDVAEKVTLGPDPKTHLDAIREYEDAGYDHVYVHQIGPDQDGFFRFYSEEILPEVR